MGWINIFGMIIVVLMLLPNILYAFKNKTIENKCRNKTMNMIEQIGRYGSMFFMAFHIGIYELGFRSNLNFVIWLITTIILILLYWLIWFFYFLSPQSLAAMLLAIIPSIIFIFSGYFARHWLLLISGVIFSVGHIYVTHQNNVKREL
jgi:hypothetical protein